MHKESGYDKITGEWYPEEWGNSSFDIRTKLYPPAIFKNNSDWHDYEKNNREDVTKAMHNLYPDPSQKSVSIGNGHELQARIFKNNDGIESQYIIYGIGKTEKEAHSQADKYLNYHLNKFGINHKDIEIKNDKGNMTLPIDSRFNDDGEYDIDNYTHPDDYKMRDFRNKNKKPSDPGWQIVTRDIKPLIDNNGKHIGYSWQQSHYNYKYEDYLNNIDDLYSQAKKDIESVHKDLYDINSSKNNKFASYNKITGEWEPEEWGTHYSDWNDRDHFYYPPLLHKTYEDRENFAEEHRGGSWDEAWDNFYPRPDQHSANIGNGHKLQAMIWKGYPNEIHNLYTITGISKTEEEANAQADKYINYHINKFGIPKNEIERRDYSDTDYNFTNFYDTSNGLIDPDSSHLHAERYVKPLYDNDANILGYSWQQEHIIPVHAYSLLGREKGFEKARKDIENVHKNLYDMNNNTKTAKVYSFDENGNIKIADRLSPKELGPEFSGVDAPNQTVGEDVDNQPQEVSETIPGNSFFTHDTLASRLFLAEIEDTNYEGVGSVFGEGMGPQDLSNNVADVEEGPKGPKGTEQSTTQLPASLQGQAVLPDVTSWFTSSKYDDSEYDSYTEDDDSDDDDEDDYDDNYSW